MLEQLFGIRYTGNVDGNLYGYTVRDAGDCGLEAIVHTIDPTGPGRYAGQVNLSHCETVGQQMATVKAYMEGWLYT